MCSDTNVVLICIDCLRSDFVRDDHADTPFLNETRDRGTFFSNMHSTATTTTPCVASILTGNYSEGNGVNSHHNVKLDPELDTLAESFGSEGYNTYAMVTGPIVEDTGLDRGFDRFWYRDRNRNLVNEWKRTAIQRLDRLSEPYFLYVHLWELHGPIEVPEPYDTTKYGPLSAPHAQKYSRMLSALDRSLEAFCSALPENTAVAITGDHGEHLTGWERPFYNYIRYLRNHLRYDRRIDLRPIERAVNRLHERVVRPQIPDHFLEAGHGHTVFDVETNVPLILSSPESDGETVDTLVRQIDIFPTLLQLAGISNPETSEGKPLLPSADIDDRNAYIRACGPPYVLGHSIMRAVRTRDYKYIEYPERDWSPDLYSLDDDPEEHRPAHDDETASRLAEKMPEDELRDREDLDVDDLLRDLGYL
ncbi:MULTISPECIES: sulfatase-like hydrolase/transferase [unclassified Haladaptatus]|uniref:sulfatase-like hydrolase/transferase n=1 Tax=unclassified Haladaptatus TaxID=2622732 RepID=UPI00209BE8DA|nr:MULTISPECIES: sulfatase-like hydrolase/transferase [unclassified Haladaptatus]MCO8244773.1 sulfatase-like hydrolase/transferase [Haladaptatus sp. AB643]MCO8255715.1 sulfatase-like hydrolase/transferase [Haladaptatus sp. AB618]